MQSYIVVARTPSGGIGKAGSLPWKHGDLAWFRRLTTEVRNVTKLNVVVMGTKTFDSVGGFLPSRLLLRATRSIPLRDMLDGIRATPNIESVFFAGGRGVYEAAIPLVDGMFITEMREDVDGCDVFFPPIPHGMFEDPVVLPGSTARYEIKFYARKKHEETQYLDLIRECLLATPRRDRTGVGTRAVFGRTMRFSLRHDVIPVFTTKKVFWRGVCTELVWFLAGHTDSKILSEQGVRIWDDNGSVDFLHKRGLTDRAQGELGPVYGHQWRAFGSTWPSKDGGVDQMSELIRTLREDPTSRRMLVSAWNPVDLPKCALPPCHVMFQCWVNADNELSCSMYQRSADMGLGVPFNVASYALLTHILARAAGLKPGDFFHVMGDTHVYETHIEALREQIERDPRPFPTLKFATETTDPFAYAPSDFELVGYDPHPALRMPMAV